jgi:hypothetical protein
VGLDQVLGDGRPQPGPAIGPLTAFLSPLPRTTLRGVRKESLSSYSYILIVRY